MDSAQPYANIPVGISLVLLTELPKTLTSFERSQYYNYFYDVSIYTAAVFLFIESLATPEAFYIVDFIESDDVNMARAWRNITDFERMNFVSN